MTPDRDEAVLWRLLALSSALMVGTAYAVFMFGMAGSTEAATVLVTAFLLFAVAGAGMALSAPVGDFIPFRAFPVFPMFLSMSVTGCAVAIAAAVRLNDLLPEAARHPLIYVGCYMFLLTVLGGTIWGLCNLRPAKPTPVVEPLTVTVGVGAYRSGKATVPVPEPTYELDLPVLFWCWFMTTAWWVRVALLLAVAVTSAAGASLTLGLLVIRALVLLG